MALRRSRVRIPLGPLIKASKSGAFFIAWANVSLAVRSRGPQVPLGPLIKASKPGAFFLSRAGGAFPPAGKDFCR